MAEEYQLEVVFTNGDPPGDEELHTQATYISNALAEYKVEGFSVLKSRRGIGASWSAVIIVATLTGGIPGLIYLVEKTAQLTRVLEKWRRQSHVAGVFISEDMALGIALNKVTGKSKLEHYAVLERTTICPGHRGTRPGDWPKVYSFLIADKRKQKDGKYKINSILVSEQGEIIGEMASIAFLII